jgi:hypothetical protein
VAVLDVTFALDFEGEPEHREWTVSLEGDPDQDIVVGNGSNLGNGKKTGVYVGGEGREKREEREEREVLMGFEGVPAQM